MRNILFSIVLMISPAMAVQAAVPYQLPGITICDARSCALSIDGDDFLRDSTSHEKVFELPFQKTVFDNYSILKAGEYYIVERSNTTSSKNWDLLVLTHSNGSTRAERVISLSRGYTMTSPEVYWSGYECRGDAIPEKQYSPFDAAKNAICGGVHQPDSENLAKSNINALAKKHGLVVNIPAYGITPKKSAIYFFPETDEPDSGALLCLENCGSDKNPSRKYGGWIGNSYWIDVDIQEAQESGNLTGSYIYVGKKGRIDLTGNLVDGKLNLRESLPERAGVKQEHAIFDGSGSKDAFAGKWHSVESGKTYEFFIASRIY
jgi:hypothetical protein